MKEEGLLYSSDDIWDRTKPSRSNIPKEFGGSRTLVGKRDKKKVEKLRMYCSFEREERRVSHVNHVHASSAT